MTYVSWAALYEGPSDRAYFDVLLPRIMEEMILIKGTRISTIPDFPILRLPRRSVEETAAEACKARDAFHIIFIHADTGGANVKSSLTRRSVAYCNAMNRLCDWPERRCIAVTPRHEMEAWVLADPEAVLGALGYRGSIASLGLPSSGADAERLPDPKRVLNNAIQEVRGRRRLADATQLLPAIAQRQSLSALRRAASFRECEIKVAAALAGLGCI